MAVWVTMLASASRLVVPYPSTRPQTPFDVPLSINSRGVFLDCKYAAQQIITQESYLSGNRGYIINMASTLGLVGRTGAVSYSASKEFVVQAQDGRSGLGQLEHPLQCPVPWL